MPVPIPVPTTQRGPEAAPPSLPHAQGVWLSPAGSPSVAASVRVRLGARRGGGLASLGKSGKGLVKM